MNTHSQRRLTIIARQRLATLLLAGSFAITTFESASAGTPHTLLHSLFDPGTNAQSGALQGYSVAVAGNFAIAGAPGVAVVDDKQAENSGVVKVYDATTGGLLRTFNNPGSPVPYNQSWEAGVDDKFGYSVAVDGTRVVVGAPYENVETTFPGYFLTDAGTAYVYDLASATPTVPVATLTDPNPGTGVGFGSSVAVSGTRVVVGAPGEGSEGTSAGSAYVYDLASTTPSVAVINLTSPNSQSQSHFGSTVAIFGTRVVVGAPDDNTGATASGIACLFDLNSATPAAPVATLTNPNPATADRFGYSVAVSGTRLIVGAPYDDAGSIDGGSAFVYELDGGTPIVPVATLLNPNPDQSNNFAFSVAMSGTRAVVGTYSDGTGTNDVGSAYVYDLASGTPDVPVAKMNNPAPAAAVEFFGVSVAVSDTRVLIGAPRDDTRALEAGSVYLYELASATPAAPVAVLNDPSPAAGDHAGNSVAISGTRVVVGAHADDTGAENAGSAYVYDLTSATPAVPVVTLNNPSPETSEGGNRFGGSVAVSGPFIVIGTPFDGANVGKTYVYNLGSATPSVPVAALTNPSPAVADWFGWSVSVSGTWVVVGAPQDDTGGSDAGIAYVYDFASAMPTAPVATLNNPNPAVSGSFGRSVAISDTRLVVGAPHDRTETHGGSAYVYDLASATPTVPVVALDNSSPSGDDYFGSSVSISGTRVVVGAPDEGAYTGGAYVYDLVSATPNVPVATLRNPKSDGSPSFGMTQADHFGSSVAISGTRVVVGAPYDNAATNGGIAYVYELASATPTIPVATLANPSPAGYDRFGLCSAIDGTTIVVGDPFDNTTAPDRGAAYVFGPVQQLSNSVRGNAQHPPRRVRHRPIR